MKILIVGDSWGCGEWDQDSRNILHGGLAQYLSEEGHEVDNLSRGGISNLDISHRMQSFYGRNNSISHDLVVVFQTEYCRDYKHDRMQISWGSDDWHQVQRVSDLAGRYLDRFYRRLSEFSVEHSVPVKIIGGCGDTMHFDNMSCDYPGCDIVCQSASNLLINQDPTIQHPVFSWYTKNTGQLLEHLRQFLGSAALEEVMQVVHQGFQRENLLRENPHMFWPDGIHPNRAGHQAIFEFLKNKDIFD